MKTQWFISVRMLGMRLVSLGVISIFLVTSIGPFAVQAKPPRMLTGDTYFYVAEWGGVEIWTMYEIKETDPISGAAVGTVQAKVYDPWNGWKSLVFSPECVNFTAHAVTMVMEIQQKTGEGNGEVGEHAKWQIVDGGSPGRQNDSLTIINYQEDPWIEYWPVGVAAPSCTSPGTGAPIFVTEGNLTIH